MKNLKIFEKILKVTKNKKKSKKIERWNFSKCTCSRWTCIDEIDLSYIQSLISGPVSLLKDHEVDQQFKCWKTCCKKQGLFYLDLLEFFIVDRLRAVDTWSMVSSWNELRDFYEDGNQEISD